MPPGYRAEQCELWRWLRRAALRRWWCVLASWRDGLLVCHAGSRSLLHEMLGKEYPSP